MPINFTDFSRAPLVDSGLGDLLGHVMRGIQLQRTPGMLNRQQQAEELKNALSQMQNKYYPQITEASIANQQAQAEKARLEAQYKPQEMANKIKESELKQAILALKGQFLPQTHQANIDLLKAKADKARRIESQTPGKHSPIYNDLAAIYGEGTPEFAEAVKQARGIPTSVNTPADQELRFSDLSSKNEQLDVSKRMRNDLKAAHSVKKAIGTLNEMRRITLENPGLSDTLANIFIDPKKESSIISKATKTFLNKKDRAAVEKYIKLGNDLILQGGEGLGAKNFTDAKAKIIELSKANAGNSQEANLFVIDNMIRQLQPWEAYAQDLKRGLRERKVVEFDLDKYESPNEDEWEVVG
jgi:hypothetical protein